MKRVLFTGMSRTGKQLLRPPETPFKLGEVGFYRERFEICVPGRTRERPRVFVGAGEEQERALKEKPVAVAGCAEAVKETLEEVPRRRAPTLASFIPEVFSHAGRAPQLVDAAA